LSVYIDQDDADYWEQFQNATVVRMALDPVQTAAKLFGRLSEKQKEIVGFEEDEIFLGGGAGSGKTRGVIMAWAAPAFEFQARGFKYDALAIRRTFPQLKEIIALGKEMLLPLGATWHEASKTFILPGGSSLECGYCERDDDRFQYTGRAWALIFVDEIQRYATPVFYDWIFSRLRAPIKEIAGKLWRLPLRVFSTANPKGPGNHWLRKRFIDTTGVNGGTCTRTVETVTPAGEPTTVTRKVRFQHSTVLDNPWLRNTDYVRNLMLLPEADRRALLEGDFYIVEGAFFSEFNRKIHVVKTFKPPPDIQLINAGDWGTAHPSHFGWMQELSNGEFHVFSEYSTRDQEDWSKGTWRNATDVAEDLIRIEHRQSYDVSERWLDSACFSDDGTGTNVGEIFHMKGLYFQKSVKGKNLKARNLRELMKVTNGSSRLKIHDQCKYLIWEIENLMTDEQDPSRWDERGSDHGVDMLQYGTARNIIALGGDVLHHQKQEAYQANRAKMAAMRKRGTA
jgi:hypothetical protein